MESAEVNFSIAGIAGVNAAIVLSLIIRRVETAREAGTDRHNGRYWVRTSMDAISESIPFMSVAAVRTAVRKLRESGLVDVKNFNSHPYDHTKWYALTDKAEALIKASACRPENVIH